MRTESLESLETRLHDLGDFIRDQRRNARLSLRKLSELAGISNPYLSHIARGLRKPRARAAPGASERRGRAPLTARRATSVARPPPLPLFLFLLFFSSLSERQKQ